jgi:hypothetical protein
MIRRHLFTFRLPDAEVERLEQVLRTATESRGASPKLTDDPA